MASQLKQKLSLIIVAMAVLAGANLYTGHVSAADEKKTDSKSQTKADDKGATTDLSTGITRSFSAGPEVQVGMAVKLDPKDKSKTKIVPLSQKTIKDLLGIVVPNGNASIVLTPSEANQSQMLVTPSGQLTVLVSDQNGPVKRGDYIVLSALDGIGMKADATQSVALGRAEGDFDGKTNVINTTKVQNSLKKDVNIAIGRVPMEVGVTRNPTFQESSSDYVPAFIGKIVFQVTSKNVSAARIYIAMVILLGIIILCANILFGGVRGGMVAVGRNPLSKKSIIISLVQTVFFATAIFVGGVAGVFFLLKL